MPCQSQTDVNLSISYSIKERIIGKISNLL